MSLGTEASTTARPRKMIGELVQSSSASRQDAWRSAHHGAWSVLDLGSSAKPLRLALRLNLFQFTSTFCPNAAYAPQLDLCTSTVYLNFGLVYLY